MMIFGLYAELRDRKTSCNILRMIGTALEFAPGTTDECKQVVGKLFTAPELMSAYRMARGSFGTGDLVLRVSQSDPSGFEAETRSTYVQRVKQLFGKIPLLMRGIAEKSAHSVVKLPFEGEAFWFIVVRGAKEVPIMCVLFGTPYSAEQAS